MFLHYLTLHKNWNATLTSWSRGSLTLGTVFLRASSTKPLTSGKHGCVHVWRQRDVTSNDCDVATQPALFRATYTPNQLFSEPITLLRGRQQQQKIIIIIIMTGKADGMNPGVDLETSWCISEWEICECDFQWRDGWWARKGGNRWGTGTSRGLNRDQIVKIARFSGCKNFVGKWKNFIFNAFDDLTPLERFENGSDMWWLTTAGARWFWICWSRLSW